jgi:hypothetical protein
MSSYVSSLSPTVPTMDYPDDMFNVMSDIVTRKIVSYPDTSNLPQPLVIGATSDLALESKGNTNLHVDPTKDVNFYHTSIDSGDIRHETRFMTLSASNNSTELLAPNSKIKLSPGDTDRTTNVGSMTVNENTVSQLLNTDKTEFKVMKNMSVLGDFSLTGQFFAPNLSAVNLMIDNSLNVTHQVANGGMFGNNMNIWINKDDSPGDRVTNQIGYGFRINSNTEQLELFKYKRFSFLDSNGDVKKSGKTQYRKVAHFGFGVSTYDKDSDITNAEILETFGTLDTLVSIRSNNSNAGTGGSGTSGTEFWLMNSNANIYHYGAIGINNPFPKYAIDVNGNIMASDTVIATNYATASDRRIKSDILRLDNSLCLDKIMQLIPSSFNIDNQHRIGFIAQELKEVIPESVYIKENATYGIEDFHYVDYNSILGNLVGAVQELGRKVSELESGTRHIHRHMKRTIRF